MKGEYISIETAKIMADIEKENKMLQEENLRLRNDCNYFAGKENDKQHIINDAIEYIEPIVMLDDDIMLKGKMLKPVLEILKGDYDANNNR